MTPPFMLPSTERQLATPMELVLLQNHTVQQLMVFDAIPPVQYQQIDAQRINVQQGLHSAYVDRYGEMLPTVTLQWTTSTTPAAGGSQDPDGYDKFLRLLIQIFRAYYTAGETDPFGTWALHLYDYPHQQFMEVEPVSDQWSHAIPENLALTSQLQFLVLRFINAPGSAPPTLTQQTLVEYAPAWVQTIAQSAMVQNSALAAYLGPETLTPAQQIVWPQTQFFTQWAIPDYTEWFGNANVPTSYTANLSLFANQLSTTILEPLLNTPQIPYPVSLAVLQNAIQAVNQWLTAVRALTPPPYWVTSLLEQLAQQLPTLTLNPQVLLP